MLLMCGADPSARTSAGETALDWARKGGSDPTAPPKPMELLLLHGPLWRPPAAPGAAGLMLPPAPVEPAGAPTGPRKRQPSPGNGGRDFARETRLGVEEAMRAIAAEPQAQAAQAAQAPTAAGNAAGGGKGAGRDRPTAAAGNGGSSSTGRSVPFSVQLPCFARW